jgi:hypothetical protein
MTVGEYLDYTRSNEKETSYFLEVKDKYVKNDIVRMYHALNVVPKPYSKGFIIRFGDYENYMNAKRFSEEQ